VRRAKRPTKDGKFDGATANRALELLGKEIGMFVERSENYNSHNVIRSEPLSEAEWAEMFCQPAKPN
jgi:hypothetical protein